MKSIKWIFFIFLLLPLGSVVFAQEGIQYYPHKSWQAGVTSGTFLPFGIPGVRNTYPWTGVFLSQPTRFTHIEYMLLGGNAKGVRYHVASLSFKTDFSVYDVINGFWALGFNQHHYQRAPNSTRDFGYQTEAGVHGGFGVYGQLSGPLHLRADVKMHLSPGKSLYFGLGFVFHFWPDNPEK